MRVLHIEDRFNPDMGYQINFFAKYHDPSYEFYILASDSFSIWGNVNPDEIVNKSDAELEKKYNVKIVRNKSKRTSSGKYNIWICNLMNTIDEINPDIIYIHSVETLTSLRLFFNSRIVKKYRVFVDTHTLLNQITNEFKNNIFLFFFRNIVTKKINKYHIGFFYTTLENRMIAEKYYGIKNENLLSCPIGTTSDNYYFDEESRNNIRKQYNILEEQTVVIYTGKLDYKKQPHLILQAVKMIENSIDKEIHLFFIGNKNVEYFNEYFNITFNNSNIHLHIVDAVKSQDLYKYYSFADYAVFPEENTLSALDAQLCGLPVIMQDDMTNAERLEKGGLLFQKNNIKSLSEQILLLLNDSKLRKKLGVEGREYVKEKFDYKKIIYTLEQSMFADKIAL